MCRIKAPTVPPAQRRVITPEQFTLIHQALPTPEVRLLVETDIETGLRWGELVELRVRDLDLQHGLVAVSRTVIEIPAKFHPTGDPHADAATITALNNIRNRPGRPGRQDLPHPGARRTQDLARVSAYRGLDFHPV